VALMGRWERRVGRVSVVAGVMLLLVTLSFVLADGQLGQRSTLLLFAALALVIVQFVVEPRLVGVLLRRRRSSGSPGVLLSAVVVGLLVGVNVVASRATAGADLTRSGLYTLSPQSVQVTRQLSADLLVTAFFRPDEQDAQRQAQTLLDLYRQQSSRVQVRFVDPGQEEALALSLGVKVAGSVVLQYRGLPPVVLDRAAQTESSLTAAIQRLETARSPVVCWAGGDGERDLHDVNEVDGYSGVSDVLRSGGYLMQDLLLVQQGVPAACDVLVVLQLARPLADASVKAVQDYLARGGRLLMGMDPWVDPKVLASANGVLRPYGVGFEGGLVIEGDSKRAATDDPTIPVVFDFGRSPVTQVLQGHYVFLPHTTPIVGQPTGGVTSIDLASTSDRSFDIAQQRTSLDRHAVDRPGPFVLMRSLEQELSRGRSMRAVLVGTSALAENRTLPPSASGSNPDLFLAALGWLSQQLTSVAIAPRPAAAEPLDLSDLDLRFNEILTVGLMPLAVLATGVLVWRRRRRARPAGA
jgi:ABC-type uncharacterized transport system involved in gliding motility auxiliary subunit